MKKLLMAISLIMVTVLLLSSLPMGVLAEAETITEMKAVNFDANSADKTNNTPAKNTQIRAEEDKAPLISELPSDRFVVEWENELPEDEFYKDSANAATAVYNIFWLGKLGTNSTTARLSYVPNVFDITKHGVMFYVKLDAESAATTIYFETSTTKFVKNENDEYDNIYLNGSNQTETKTIPFVDSDAAFLRAGTDEWVVDTKDHKLGAGPRGSSAAVEIPAGFEGFVYLPNNTIADYSRLGDGHVFAYRFNVYVGHMNNEHDIEFSNFMIAPPTIDEVTSADGFTANGVTYKYAEQLRFNAEALTVLGAEQSHNGFYTVDSNTGALAESYNKADVNLSVTVGADAEKELLAPSKLGADPIYEPSFTNMSRSNAPVVTSFKKNSTTLYKFDSYNSEDYTDKVDNGNDLATFSNSAKIENVTGRALLFYVKHEDATAPMVCDFTMEWRGLLQNSVYYAYDNATGEWSEKLTNAYNSGVSVISNKEGTISIPVDFEGWLLIPHASFRDNADVVSAQNFRIAFYSIGGKYGTLTVGDMSVIDAVNPVADNAALKVSAFVSNNGKAFPRFFPFNTAATKTEVISTDWYKSAERPETDVTVKTVLDKTTGNITISTDSSRPFKINSSNVITSNGATSAQCYQFTNGKNPALSATGAIIFYVKNDTAGDYVAIMGENNSNMDVNAPYYLLGKYSDKWVKYTASSAAYSLSGRTHGTISIPAGFEGFVSLPLTSLYDNHSTVMKYRNEAPGNLRYFTIQTGAIEKGSVYISNLFASTTVTPSHFAENGEYKGAVNAIPDVSGKTVVTVKNENGTFTNANDVVCSTLYVEQNIPVGGGLMFWVKTDKAVSFKLSVGDMSTAKKYGTDRKWTTALENGYIALPAGFSGWVKIAVPDGAVGEELRVTFASVSNGFKISDFMSLNTSDDLEKISVDNSREKSLVYREGDFSLDDNVDILDLVVSNVFEGATSLYEFTSLNGEGTQSDLLRALLLK